MPMTRDGGSKISEQTNHSKPPISLISFRHKPNFPNTSCTSRFRLQCVCSLPTASAESSRGPGPVVLYAGRGGAHHGCGHFTVAGHTQLNAASMEVEVEIVKFA
jgi:hypothetical protein